MSSNGESRRLSDSFSQILPTLSAGARALRDPAAYLVAALIVGVTVVPGVAIWYLAVGRVAGVLGRDPFATSPGPTMGDAGLVAIVTFLVGLLLLAGYVWAWMALGVRAASLERGAPLPVGESVATGLRRALVAVGGWLLLLVVGIPLLILYVVARLMADVVVLSGVSVVVTMALVVAVFAWWLALLLVTYLVAAFAAADHDAGVFTVLRRAFGLTISNPAAVIVLLLSVWVVATVLVFALYGPTFFAGTAGFSIVGVMGTGGRTISAALLGAFVAIFGAVVLFLIPVSFAASALASFAVRIEPDLARIEQAERDARQRLSSRLRRSRAAKAADTSPPPEQAPPPQGPPASHIPPPDQGPPSGQAPPDDRTPPDAASPEHEAPPDQTPPDGPPTRELPTQEEPTEEIPPDEPPPREDRPPPGPTQ